MLQAGCIKVPNFCKYVSFSASQQAAPIKNLKQQNLKYSFSCEKLIFSAEHVIIHIF